MRIRALLSMALVASLAACGEESSGGGGPGGHHEHLAPHGGALQVLGEEFAHVELVFDPKSGRLTAFVLDGEAESPVRVAHPSIDLTVGGEKIELRAVASPLTGETVGDTSQFEGASERLRGATQFDGVLRTITARGVKFDDVRVGVPHGNEGTGTLDAAK